MVHYFYLSGLDLSAEGADADKADRGSVFLVD